MLLGAAIFPDTSKYGGGSQKMAIVVVGRDGGGERSLSCALARLQASNVSCDEANPPFSRTYQFILLIYTI